MGSAQSHAKAATRRMELIADGLHFPTSLALDGEGRLHVAESGLALGGAPAGGRIVALQPDGTRRLVIDRLGSPVTGLTWLRDAFLVSEGGDPGRISRVTVDGRRGSLVEGLPGGGNYHTNMVAAGPDGWLYFSVGAMTNSGVVGPDGADLAWLRAIDHRWDVPGFELELAGINFESPPLPGVAESAVTGAFSPFGEPTRRGQRVPAGMPCTASVLCCRPDGSQLRLHAWGLRNAFGLGFAPDGRLLATDQGADDRGSRPIGHCPELLFEVRPGAWHGWPDFVGGVPITDPRFQPERGPHPRFILANHDELPPPERPLAVLPENSSAAKFDFLPPGGDFEGHLILALFGDEKPMTAPEGPAAGRSVVRVDPDDGSVHPIVEGLLKRPIDIKVDPVRGRLYLIDFGEFEMRTAGGVHALPGSGKVWRVDLEELF